MPSVRAYTPAAGARAIGASRTVGRPDAAKSVLGISPDPLSHAEVLETTTRVAKQFQDLVQGVVARL